MDEIARSHETGRWIGLTIDKGTIAGLAPADGPEETRDTDAWIAPAFWDLQINGRWGIDFSGHGLTVEHAASVVRGQAELGTARLCPTLITAPLDRTEQNLRTIAAACEALPDVAESVVGVHLEGPWISELDGYRGAHPLSSVRDPDWDDFKRLQDAAGGRIVLVTLAPERHAAIEFIRRATASGVVVAVGHTAADGPTLRSAAAAGARLSTHLGNGIASILPRHPNPIWEQSALDDLSASLIADGHHLDASTLRALVRAKGPERVILVSDASALAGLPPGRYGDWEVAPSGKIVVAGAPYLAGSNQGLAVGIDFLLRVADVSLTQALDTVARNPARLLREAAPRLAVGERANLVRFRRPRRGAARGFELLRTCVAGRWVEAGSLADLPSAT